MATLEEESSPKGSVKSKGKGSAVKKKVSKSASKDSKTSPRKKAVSRSSKKGKKTPKQGSKGIQKKKHTQEDESQDESQESDTQTQETLPQRQEKPPAPREEKQILPQSDAFRTLDPSVKDEMVVKVFQKCLKDEPTTAIAIAAIQALTEVVKASTATTMMGLEIELKAAADLLKSCNKTSISLSAGCELFNRYVTRTYLDLPNFEVCKSKLLERGYDFTQMSLKSRQHIATLVDRFIKNDQVILVHGFSRVVNNALLHAAKQGKYFRVVTTEGRPQGAGYQTAKALTEKGIPITLVLDSAVGYIMEKVDLVLVGAEGVVENGGIINKIGTYQTAIIAKSIGKPFYVAAESYKFARLFPLNQSDLPEGKDDQLRLKPPLGMSIPPEAQIDNPSLDYTPPKYITLLFTDLGILTPSAVSDELIKLYY